MTLCKKHLILEVQEDVQKIKDGMIELMENNKKVTGDLNEISDNGKKFVQDATELKDDATAVQVVLQTAPGNAKVVMKTIFVLKSCCILVASRAFQ